MTTDLTIWWVIWSMQGDIFAVRSVVISGYENWKTKINCLYLQNEKEETLMVAFKSHKISLWYKKCINKRLTASTLYCSCQLQVMHLWLWERGVQNPDLDTIVMNHREQVFSKSRTTMASSSIQHLDSNNCSQLQLLVLLNYLFLADMEQIVFGIKVSSVSSIG